MEGTDVCFAPVLSMAEAPGHPHNAARETFVEYEWRRPAGACAAFLAHAGRDCQATPGPGEHTDEILADWDVARLMSALAGHDRPTPAST